MGTGQTKEALNWVAFGTILTGYFAANYASLHIPAAPDLEVLLFFGFALPMAGIATLAVWASKNRHRYGSWQAMVFAGTLLLVASGTYTVVTALRLWNEI